MEDIYSCDELDPKMKGKKKKKHKKKKKKKKTPMQRLFSVTAVVVILSVLVTACTSLLMRTKILNDNSEGSMNPDIINPSDDVINFLFLGTDYRESESSRSNKLTDTIMVASLDIKANKLNILQIPRDTYVGDASSDGKINSVYSTSKNYKGASGVANLIHELFQIKIDHYIVMDMDGFVEIIDKIGGVNITIPENITESGEINCEGITIKAGTQTLTGEQAQIFVRFRNEDGGLYQGMGDVGRLKVRPIFFKAFFRQMLETSTTKLMSLVPTASKSVTTGMSVGEMLGLVSTCKKLEEDGMSIDILPGEAYTSTASYYSVHKQECLDLINEKYRAHLDPVTLDDLKCVEKSNKKGDYWYKLPED